jgi:hypothetical protein
MAKFEQQRDGSLLTSVAWERYVPTDKEVHGYGCRTAYRRNRKREGKITPKNRSVYCGAYQLTAKAARELTSTQNPGEISSAELIHHIEEGEIAHTNLRIVLSLDAPILDSTKTAIVDRLWNACSGPLLHSCSCDQDVDPHPNRTLTGPPRGAYSDTRSRLSRRWYVIRFRALHWLWCVCSGIAHDPESEQPTERRRGID